METASRNGWSASDWAVFLTDRFGLPVRVHYGRSRTAPVQARAFQAAPDVVGWELRLHRAFADAPEDVRSALASWLRVGRRARKAGPILDDWIHAEIASLPRAPRRLALETSGDVHDLEALSAPLFEGEFAADFAPESDLERPHISWGRRVKSRSRRSLRLGSFEPENRVVRVHPVLDQEAVPAWFVRFVLKHEILHAVIDAYRDASGRWVHHGPEFRRREASWVEHEPALLWERRNLARLIRSAREGTKLRVRADDLAGPPEDSPRTEIVTPERTEAIERPRDEAPRQQLLPF
ncbi:MAG: hypothetical protein AAF957_21605 [Planctomycetota bacterium]